ncbi:carbohydrate-responsive element-binding protein isoform X2 [Plodia interpunctella]|uniref:carbohydrate-responsive element-binding protein isoform X2 n=1 Tax=Plodia interpunctella TaxID=58824 RepID=UPI0023685A9C|nr:carbohydrate-responsive element-binding protein isoform X2 [Plodia interpunctella]
MTHVEKRQPRPGREAIHSGHFMVSHFEAEAQDEFDDLAVPVPDEEQNVQKVTTVATYTVPSFKEPFPTFDLHESKQQLSIEISLTKLFKCMTLAYRQKLTSPKWNRFKGIKLRWKDKIRLNNVIWRCWHMQFIKKQNTLVCQFASPLDVDTHVKPETTILEGKYWKRRAEAVIAEYKKWRMFHIMRLFGKGDTSVQYPISDMDMDTAESFSQCSELAGNMLTDEDYLNFMSDTLFSTITSHQPFAFPDCREIARGASLADFIQPSLGPLQPNLDDYMELEPFQELLSTPRLPPVPEESALSSEEPMYRSSNMSVDSYPAQGFMSTAHAQGTSTVTMPSSQMTIHGGNNNTQMMSMSEQTVKNEQIRMYDSGRMYNQSDMQDNMMNTQEMMPYQQTSYGNSAQEASLAGVYMGKRMQYVNTPKIVTQDGCYPKYSNAATAVPPSQTAPETVSLLQQPSHNKYAATIVMSGRGGFAREKTRTRLAHYQYQYLSPDQPPSYEPRPAQRAPPPMQYLPTPVDSYKAKTSSAPSRSFKMPSPPLAPSTSQQVSVASSGTASVVTLRGKQEQFRSHSLPLGAQLNPDWSVSAPPAPPPAPAPADTASHSARARESHPSALRMRSRSTSSGALGDGSSGRRPPPLNSVASEPSLPQASVMLAQLLSAQLPSSTSPSPSKAASEERAEARHAQPSPIGSDVMSPHHSLSPPLSPTSERAASPSARRTHLHAEQKRRYNIKNGFDTLQALIPHLNANPAAKISKAAMLQKGAEYIKQLKAERNQIKEEMESLRQQIEYLNNSISNCHSLLPATGAPVSRARAGRLREMFARHVAARTLDNWKYWLFSIVAAALVESFSSCVSCGSGADLVRTTLLWAEQHCSLVEMRPAVLNSLRVLCTKTDILTNPERLPEEARAAVAGSAGVKTEPT